MALNRQAITTAEFETFINLPKNADKLFELIGGEIIDVPSNPTRLTWLLKSSHQKAVLKMKNSPLN